MSMTYQATCSERIDGYLKGRIEDWDDAFNLIDDAREQGDWDTADQIMEDDLYVLSVTQEVVLRIDIGTGGPADWLEVFYGPKEYFEQSTVPTRIIYHFADWFDHASKVLEGDEFATAMRLAETYEHHLFSGS